MSYDISSRILNARAAADARARNEIKDVERGVFLLALLNPETFQEDLFLSGANLDPETKLPLWNRLEQPNFFLAQSRLR